MVDGLGDGLVIECATEDTDYLRTTSFGLLQVGIRSCCWCTCGLLVVAVACMPAHYQLCPAAGGFGCALQACLRLALGRPQALAGCEQLLCRDGCAPASSCCSLSSSPPTLHTPQGCRMRNTKTEYVSCPSCGRTLFNLQVRQSRGMGWLGSVAGRRSCRPLTGAG